MQSNPSGRKFRFHAGDLERAGLAKPPGLTYLSAIVDESRIDLRPSTPYNDLMADSASPHKSCGRRATLALIGITQAIGRRKETNMHIAIRTTLQTGLIGKWVDRSNGCYRPKRM